MEDLDTPLTEARAGRAPVEAFRTLEGVPVRELVVLEVAVEPSCLVGDLVGDLPRLVGRAGLGTGLGLGALRLILFWWVGSVTVLGLRAAAPVEAVMLLGLGRAAGRDAGCCMMLMVVGRTNMPLAGAQSK